MSALTRVRHVSADVTRRVGRRVLRSRFGRRLRRPSVTVLLPVPAGELDGEAGTGLARSLASLRALAFTDLEVLVLCGTGSADQVAAAVREAGEARVRCIVVGSGQGVDPAGELFAQGVARSRGRWLHFLRPGDELTRHGLGVMVAQARRSGSGVVCAAVKEFDSERTTIPLWAKRIYEAPHLRVSLAQFPDLVGDLTWTRKLFEASTLAPVVWDSAATEGGRAVLQVLNAVPAVDVIPDVAAREPIADGLGVLRQQGISAAELANQVQGLRDQAELLADLPVPVRRAWAEATIEFRLVRFLSTPSIAQDDYWTLVSRATVAITGQADGQVWAALPPGIRVLVELARQGRRAGVAEFVRLGAVNSPGRYGTQVRPDGLEVQLPFLGDPDLPTDLFVLHRDQLDLTYAVDRVSWTAESFEMQGWAFIDLLDLNERASHVDVVLTGRQSGTEQVWTAVDEVPLASAAPSNRPTTDVSRATFAVRVPTADVLADGQDRAWDVSLRVTAAGFTVTEQVRQLVRSGSAGSLQEHTLADGTGLAVRWRPRHPLRLALEPAAVQVEELVLTGRRLTGRLADGGLRVSRLELNGAGVAAPEASGRFEVDVPTVTAGAGAPAGAEGIVTLGGVNASGQPVRLACAAPVAPATSQPDPSTVLVLGRAPNGAPTVTVWRLGAEALEVRTDDDGGLVVTGVVRAAADRGVRGVRLLTRAVKSHSRGPMVTLGPDGTFTATSDLCHDVHRYGRWPLPHDEHDLSLEFVAADGSSLGEAPLAITTELNDALPIPVLTDHLEGRVLRGSTGAVMLRLVRPLGRMGSSYHQERLKREAAGAGTEVATHRGILFRSYFGERATDNGLSIGAELARRGSDLPVYWAVQDHSVPVPEGTRAVVVNSQEWFRLLREVTYYLDNMYQPQYHHRPAGQVITQTFHGYPFKLMGRQNWNRLEISHAQAEEYLRRSAEWDYLVSPARYATPLLVRDFEYDGEVLEIGYPRNDVLLSAEADGIRRATRESLGIGEDQTVVLYAPTFREARATGHSKALLDDFFDFEEFHRHFGDSAVVLMRGHAFHARTSQRVGDDDGVIDVTDYPEVADLLLAADVCVADYSSLRFDFAVTGKPLVFLVPDLADYVADRGWLLDFELTAPGPLVTDTAGIIDAVRDLPGLRREYAAQYETFRRDFLDLEDGRAGARFVDAVIVPRGDAPAAD